MFLLQKHPKYKWAIALTDYISLNGGLICSILLLDFTNNEEQTLYSSSRLTLVIAAFLFSSIQVLFFQILGLYRHQAIVNNKDSIFLLAKAYSLSIPFFFLLLIAFDTHNLLWPLFFLTFATSLSLLSLSRYLCILAIAHIQLFSDRVIVIGAGARGRSIRNIFAKGFVNRTVGFIDDNIAQGELVTGVPVLGKIFESHLIAKKNKVDFFVMAIDNISRDHFYEVLSYFNEKNLTIYVTSSYLNVLQKNIPTDKVENHSLVRIGNPQKSRPLMVSKRVFDVLGSAVGILIFSPVFLILSILIAATSKGPIIYKQTRIGKNGQPFTFFKFRSMRVNSDQDKARNEKAIQFIRGEAATGTNTKIVNHLLITPVGKFIRKTSLDELPQLFNVLKGEMSLVGPRPCLPAEWNVYESWQKQRLRYMPGCTGIWQVSGRSKVNFEETVLMDVYYNSNISLWLDLKILFNTIPVMIFSKGGE